MQRCLGCFEVIEDELKTCPTCGYQKDTPAEEAVHMEPGTLLAQRYRIGKVLGYGGFGVTYIAWDEKLEQKVAIKEYMPSEFSTRMPGQSELTIFNGVKSEQFESGLAKFVDEAKKLSKFQKEDGIIRIFDCINENKTAYIIMEYLEGETLSERLKRDITIPEAEAINLIMPVMKSLEEVHKEGIVHRDIAPENIFITKDGRVKLIDFGAARFATTSHSRSLTVIIKPGYSAEEQYRSRSDQGPHTDVYSLAATLYKMITGETPPDALERRAKIENSKKDILIEPHKIKKAISLITENAILNALNIRIEDRTQTIQTLINDLTADEPVKRVYGKIKGIDLYRMPLWIKILVPSLLVLFVIFGVLLATGIIKVNTLFKTHVEIPEGYTVVPNIEGLDIDEATGQLISSQLRYTTGGNVTSDYISANLIAYQDVISGRTVPVNSIVSITASRGTGDVVEAVNGISTVPVFTWSEESVAISDFETAGLITSVEYVYDENVGQGQVIRALDSLGNDVQSGDHLIEGSVVTIVVSLGPEFAVGNTLYLGMYNDEPIEWRILDAQDNQILVVTNSIIDIIPYNDVLENCTWETCSLRDWLNNSFYNSAFSSVEQSNIQLTTITTEPNSFVGTDAGNDTNDRLFLLSYEDIIQYFQITDSTSQDTIAYDSEGNPMPWWLRTPGSNQTYAMIVDADGNYDSYQADVPYEFVGVRPAMWVDVA